MKYQLLKRQKPGGQQFMISLAKKDLISINKQGMGMLTDNPAM
jgi:hypothetical protein